MSNQVSSQSHAFAEEVKTLLTKYGFNYLCASAAYPSDNVDHKATIEVRLAKTDDGRIVGKIREESFNRNEAALSCMI